MAITNFNGFNHEVHKDFTQDSLSVILELFVDFKM